PCRSPRRRHSLAASPSPGPVGAVLACGLPAASSAGQPLARLGAGTRWRRGTRAGGGGGPTGGEGESGFIFPILPSRRAEVHNKGYTFSVAFLTPHRTLFDRDLYATHILLRHADIPGRAPEYRRAKVPEDFGVFLWGSRDQYGGPRRGWC